MYNDDKISLLVVDDSFLMRKLIREIAEDTKDILVIGEAKSGEEAIEMILTHEPDVVTMDFNMTGMNGAEAVKKIMDLKIRRKPSVIMVSASTKEGAQTTFDCLKNGAVDFITKPSGEVSIDIKSLSHDLVRKIKAAVKAQDFFKRDKKDSFEKGKIEEVCCLEALVIGASTGGPPVVESILCSLSSKMNQSIFVVQHMPEDFTASFAQRLNKICEVKVKEAENGELVEPGTCYIAKGNKHMLIIENEGRKTISLNSAPSNNGFRPSIDYTMISLSQIYKDKIIGILLTGMGIDGGIGMAAIKISGGQTIVQSPESSIVSSMPKTVIEKGMADIVLDGDKIGKQINKIII